MMVNLFSAVGGPLLAGRISTLLFLGDIFGTHRGSVPFTENQRKSLFLSSVM